MRTNCFDASKCYFTLSSCDCQSVTTFIWNDQVSVRRLAPQEYVFFNGHKIAKGGCVATYQLSILHEEASYPDLTHFQGLFVVFMLLTVRGINWQDSIILIDISQKWVVKWSLHISFFIMTSNSVKSQWSHLWKWGSISVPNPRSLYWLDDVNESIISYVAKSWRSVW